MLKLDCGRNEFGCWSKREERLDKVIFDLDEEEKEEKQSICTVLLRL